MKAIRIYHPGEPEVMQIEELERPVPQRGEVLIQVAVVGVNYADVMQRQGVYPVPQFPIILGSEVAGTVVACGPGVTTPCEGTRVIAGVSGGYAEYSIAEATHAIPIPDNLDFAHASALFVQGLTAYQVLHDTAQLQPGERVLVHAAAGGVGSLAVQLAKWMGAKMVIGTASTESKLAFIRSLEADAAVHYTQENWMQQVSDLTDGHGVDIVLDSVGGSIGEKSLFCLAPFGRIVVFGAASGQETQFTGQQLIWKNQRVFGYTLRGQSAESLAHAAQELFQALSHGEMQVHLAPPFAFDQAVTAHHAMQQRLLTGKVVLVM